MAWSYLNLSQLQELKNFIELREHCCMNFSAIFRKKYYTNFSNNTESEAVNEPYHNNLQYSAKGKESPKANDIIVYNNLIDNSFDFSLMLSEKGHLLPISRKNIASKVINLGKGLEIFGNSLSKVHTIMGDKKSVNAILKTCFNSKVVSEGVNSFSYYIMTLDKKSFIPCNRYPKEINIRRSTQKDIEHLMPLQKNYEIEEVLPRPQMFNEIISKKHLAMILKDQIAVVAEKDGKIIAKANTNERGFVYHQIGGVYTFPEYRNIGISTALISFLVENIFDMGMKASLFVKTDNQAAIKVYAKLGFSMVEEFRITYFLYQ